MVESSWIQNIEYYFEYMDIGWVRLLKIGSFGDWLTCVLVGTEKINRVAKGDAKGKIPYVSFERIE